MRSSVKNFHSGRELRKPPCFPQGIVLSSLAIELVRSNVDVIVVDGSAAAKACKDATATIPIVFTLAVDPVADGLTASFARPGGNLTGLTMAAGYGLAGK